MSTGPNPVTAAWSMMRARRVSRPQPCGAGSADHGAFDSVLGRLAAGGIASIGVGDPELEAYRVSSSTVNPEGLTRGEALAFWINVYNAGAIASAASAVDVSADSVLRIPGVFSKPWITVAGEDLSLNDIEHGKIRRFADPRIHGALVCGSVSCPTLRGAAFSGAAVESELEEQMSSFIALGAGHVDRSSNTVTLSRVLKWYGRDFVSPTRMPTIIPSGSGSIRDAVAPWFTDSDRTFINENKPAVRFAPYDWALGCSIARDAR